MGPDDLPAEIYRLFSDPTGYMAQHWREEMAVITGAPIAFIVTILLVGLGLGWAIHQYYKKRLGDLQGRLERKNDDITSFERRLAHKDEEVKHLQEQLVVKGAMPTTNSLSPPLETKRLRIDFLESELERPHPNLVFVSVKVTNPTSLTVTNVSVHITSIVKMNEPADINLMFHLKELIGLPLMLQEDNARPSYHQPRSEVEIHAGAAATFDVGVLLKATPESLSQIALWHAAGFQRTDPERNEWVARPKARLHPGQYRIQLKAQGRDTQAETLTIEFANTPNGDMWIRRVEEIPLLS